MSDDLLIKINADAENVTKAFDDIRKQTEDLESGLEKAALISGLAFAALTAEVYESSKAFENAQKSSVELSTALQNQGIFTEELKEKYEGYAKTIAQTSGLNDDAILKAQAVAQTYLGQTEVTQELTQAIVDYGAKTGDLNSAAEKIARTIGTGTNAFAREGLVISQTATEAERMAQTLDFVNAKAGGLAEAMNKADGYSKALSSTFEKFQETIGSRFEPVISATREAVISFLQVFIDHPVLADFTAAAIAAGIAVTGIVALLGAAVPAFLAVSAAATALGVSLNLALLGIPLLIGVIVGAVTLLALNWDKSMAVIKASSAAAVTFLADIFGGLGKILSGAFSLNPTKIKEGLEQIKSSYKDAANVAAQTFHDVTESQKKAGEEQDADKKAQADKQAEIARQHQQDLVNIEKAGIALLHLENEHASQDLISLKQKEIATLKQIDNLKNQYEITALRERVAQIQALEKQAGKEETERKKEFAQDQAQAANDAAEKGYTFQAQIRDEQLAQIRATANTEADIDRNLQTELLQNKIKQRNQYLIDTKKFGATYAALNKATHTQEIQDAEQLSSQLSQLQNSKSAALKTIGKTAAIADIGIKTAQGAVAAEALSISTFGPVAGPIIGGILAGALIAYGAEQTANILGFAEGGIVTGGIPNVDSVPILAQQGELITPKKNFDEVVGAVQTSRSGGDDNTEILSVLQSIDAKISTPQQTIIQGDVLADDSYIDALVRKISDAIQYRHGRIFGVV